MEREVPVETDADGVHARPRRTGHAIADLVLALGAILISVVSLVVAVEHGRTERELVEAATWPFPEMETSRSGHPGSETVSRIDLRNVGVGPSRLISLVIRLDGRAMRTPADLLTACCGVPAGSTTDTRPRYGIVGEGGMLGVREAHQGATLLAVAGDENPVRRAFEAAWPRLRFDGCYCSVLNACWRSNLDSTGTPRPVSSCRPSVDDYHD